MVRGTGALGRPVLDHGDAPGARPGVSLEALIVVSTPKRPDRLPVELLVRLVRPY